MGKDERIKLAEPVATYFDEKACHVIAGGKRIHGSSLQGDDEFGISVDGTDMQVDLVAFNWDNDVWLAKDPVPPRRDTPDIRIELTRQTDADTTDMEKELRI